MEEWICKALTWGEEITGSRWGQTEMDAAIISFLLAAMIVIFIVGLVRRE
jgi:hypothetical protein